MDSAPKTLDRRRFVAALGLIAGAAATPAVGVERAFSVAREYVREPALQKASGGFFDRAELRALRAICDLVIPRTDTPGAVDSDVHGFVDNQILYCHSDEEQQGAKSSLAAIDRVAKRRHQDVFVDCTNADQLAVLTGIEAQVETLEAAEYDGFRFLKSMIVFGYFTSEAGATLELAFDPYPGGFVGTVPYRDIGRAWFKG